MLNSQASAATATQILNSVSAANTAAATTSTAGGYLDVRGYDGELLVIMALGAVTGTISGKLQSATDANGTGAADIAGATFGATAANSTTAMTLDPKKVVGGFLGFLGTIVTGPALVSVTVCGKKKYV